MLSSVFQYRYLCLTLQVLMGNSSGSIGCSPTVRRSVRQQEAECGMLVQTTEYGRHAADRLETTIIGWLATVRPHGAPDVVPVWYLWEDGEILIYSQPGKQKLRNISANPQVALVLDDTRGGGDVVRVEGTARIATDEAPANENPAYIAKYAAGIQRIGYTPEQFANAYSVAVRITPSRIGR